MATFRTNPVGLEDLLRHCENGTIKLPDFQRSWVWDEERIRSLIASVSLAFPVGALMTLETGGPVTFKERPVEGAPKKADENGARYLLLDGQQRMTSLYQTCMRPPDRRDRNSAPQEGAALVLHRHREGADSRPRPH